jgi:hypothetical protein
MKNKILLLLLVPLFAKAQGVNYHIYGSVNTEKKTVYAYLITEGDTAKLTKSTVNNNHFDFKGAAFREDNLIVYGILFFDEKDDIDIKKYQMLVKNKIWTPGLDEAFKYVVLEDVELIVNSTKEVKDAEIIKGTYNLQSLDFKKALSEKKTLTACVKKYASSPYSLSYLQGLVRFYQLPDNDFDQVFGNIKEMFGSLDEKLRLSKQGQALQKVIDNL